MPDNRRGLITQVASPQGIVITYAGVPGSSSIPPGIGPVPLTPPLLGGTGGGAFSGFLYQPRPGQPAPSQGGQTGDEVVALAETHGYSTTTVSAADPAVLPTPTPGASGIYAQGNLAYYNGPTGKTITLGWSSAGTLTFTGAATFNQTLNVTGISTLAATTITGTTNINTTGSAVTTIGSSSGTTILPGTVEQAASAPAWSLSNAGAIVATSAALNGASLGATKLAWSGGATGDTLTLSGTSALTVSSSSSTAVFAGTVAQAASGATWSITNTGAVTAATAALAGATLGTNKLAVGGDVSLTGKLYCASTGTPSLTSRGTGFSACSLTSGNDQRGTISATVGASGLASGSGYAVITVNFSAAYASTPHIALTLSAQNNNILVNYSGRSTSAFTINVQALNGQGSGTVISIDYLVLA